MRRLVVIVTVVGYVVIIVHISCPNSCYSLCHLTVCVCVCACMCVYLQETLLLEWLNPLYLDCVYQSQVQEEFEDSSEIQLKNFLKVQPLYSLPKPHTCV